MNPENHNFWGDIGGNFDRKFWMHFWGVKNHFHQNPRIPSKLRGIRGIGRFQPEDGKNPLKPLPGIGLTHIS